MNRLIVIGNGFDLAHGYRTSYNDFISDYFKSVVQATDYFKPYSDELITVTFNKDVEFNKKDVLRINNFPDIIDLCKNAGVTFTYNYELFRQLIEKTYITNWVDFETEYYNQLIFAHEAYKSQIGNLQSRYFAVRHLNKYFDLLKTKLIEYLSKVNSYITKEGTSDKYDSYFKTLFREEINPDEFAIKIDSPWRNEKPALTYFLNFNYTQTLLFYLNGFDQNRVKHNQIHGSLFDIKNPIIFGYGDEFNKHYLDIEALNENEFLEHMKSFQYSNNSNYHNLVRFLNEGDFQVYILGHSCGISDRVMFNRIFESDKCKSIKMFYHKKSKTENDYRAKRIEISRHFKNKSLINELVVPFDKSHPLFIY